MTQPSANKPVVAAFDFDGTLTRHDTLLPFLLHISGPLEFFKKIIVLSPVFGAYALRLMRNDVAKVKVLRGFLQHMELASLQQHALDFAENKLPKLLRSAAIERLHWHQAQGHRCVVISASLELYLKPWAEQAGFDDVLGSRLEVLQDGTVSGKLLGENCFGPEKLRRLETLLGSRAGYTLYAYGDSRGDRELLSTADYAYYRKFSE